ncbi:Gfo/Idh/MocA family protein [Streptomyces cylindrosporus]|uniref:Gfo/Idh/MocA family oxidoreductase n=1 Tax=Streptomyces cylindrosporus TaxID=2927583 RepID=A0ABS9YGP3_9ACTN|nr:Gfo/Idh/MocA family oxidoreductase [Streptomyces cylindrosporus]MCI3275041.1 Gfo/Idh/MocA family oxidoreductase [Streptomyces cylindrosporus]
MPALPVVRPPARPAPLRVGVLGCGGIAMRRMLPAMARTPLVEIAAVASRDRDRAKAAATRFDAVALHGPDGYRHLLDRDDVDAVYVPLPPALHAPWTARALESGKHALVEKPMTTDARQAHDLADLAKSRSLVLMESFMFLHHSQHRAVGRLVDTGRIGELRCLTAEFGFPPLPPEDIRYRPDLGGGALLDAGVYTVRAAGLLLGDALSVVGSTLVSDPATGVDIRGDALLRAPGPATAHLSFGFTHAYRSAYTLWGSTGRIVVGRAFTPPPDHSPVLRVERQDHVEEVTLPPDDQFANLAARFAAMVLGQEDPAPEREAAVRQAELVDAVREMAVRDSSVGDGGPVVPMAADGGA